MPELPEVETVRRGLAPAMEGARIERLQLNRPDLRFPLPENFADEIGGRRIVSLGRRAKYLLIDLEDDLTVIGHLGMSGSFRVDDETPGDFHHPRSKDGSHDHVIFHLMRDTTALRVTYNDPRRFGFMHLWKRSRLDLYPPFVDLGPEPTGNALDAAYLAGRFAGKARPLKNALLDQKVVAGLGNIYVCEALWRSRLSPGRPVGSMVTPAGKPKNELVVLTDAIRAVIDDAIAAGGSSLRDHRQTDGSLGYFQHSFSVYGREGETCHRPACTGTVARITQAGRSTFYCPICQQ